MGTVEALCVYDDGRGPAVYAGGGFAIGGHPDAPFNLARWDGQTWTKVGGGVDGTVQTMVVYDDGSGPALYVGGYFRSVGGQQICGLARWNGTSWSQVGPGLSSGQVRRLKVLDLGNGPALYIMVWDGIQAPLLCWDGVTLTTLLSVGGADITAFDAGDGPHLYSGTIGCYRLDDTGWTKIASITNTGWSSYFYCFETYDDGTGAALYAGGNFTQLEGQTIKLLARWDGTTWRDSQFELNGIFSQVAALHTTVEAGQPVLYVGGGFKRSLGGGRYGYNVVKRTPSGWQALCLPGPAPFYQCVTSEGVVRAVTTITTPTGSELIIGGDFSAMDGQAARRLARYGDGTWHAMPMQEVLVGGWGLDGPAFLVAHRWHPGGPERLVALGAGPTMATLTAGGWEYSAANSVFGPPVSYDDGSGPALFVASDRLVRRIRSSGTETIATLDNWTAGVVIHDAGDGRALYAYGSFTTVNGLPIRYVARWTGSTWVAVLPEPSGSVGFAASLYDGTQRRLCAKVGDEIQIWDGTAWESLGAPGGADDMLSQVTAAVTFDDGSGPALFMTGTFQQLDYPYTITTQVRKFQYGMWTRIGRGNPIYGYHDIGGLQVLDHGNGAELHASGRWDALDDLPLPSIARWNGTSWEPVGSGYVANTNLWGSMTVFDDDGPGQNPPALYISGSFYGLDGHASSQIARWGCRPRYPGDVNCDGHNTFADIDPFVTALGGAVAYAEHFPLCNWLNADCNDDGQVTFADIDPFVGLLGN